MEVEKPYDTLHNEIQERLENNEMKFQQQDPEDRELIVIGDDDNPSDIEPKILNKKNDLENQLNSSVLCGPEKRMATAAAKIAKKKLEYKKSKAELKKSKMPSADEEPAKLKKLVLVTGWIDDLKTTNLVNE